MRRISPNELRALPVINESKTVMPLPMVEDTMHSIYQELVELRKKVALLEKQTKVSTPAETPATKKAKATADKAIKMALADVKKIKTELKHINGRVQTNEGNITNIRATR